VAESLIICPEGLVWYTSTRDKPQSMLHNHQDYGIDTQLSKASPCIPSETSQGEWVGVDQWLSLQPGCPSCPIKDNLRILNSRLGEELKDIKKKISFRFRSISS